MELDSGNTILIVMDIQERLFSVMPETRGEMVKNCKKLLKTAKVLDVPVIVTEQYPQGLGPTIKEISETLPDSTKMLSKVEFSCANNEQIANMIEKMDRKNIVICGLETHVCIYQSSRDLAKKGYSVYVPIDAVHSRKKIDWKTGVKMIEKMGAATTTETIIFDLLKTAERQEFREINKILKE